MKYCPLLVSCALRIERLSHDDLAGVCPYDISQSPLVLESSVISRAVGRFATDRRKRDQRQL